MQDDRTLEVEALCRGAVTLTREGNRVAAMALLWAAVGIAPNDLLAHRRLAAGLANNGDVEAAAEEFARYIEFMLKAGEYRRATLELGYARSMVGDHPSLRAVAEERIPLGEAVAALALQPGPATRVLPARTPEPVQVEEPAPAIVPERNGGYRWLPPAAARVSATAAMASLALITLNNLVALAAH